MHQGADLDAELPGEVLETRLEVQRRELGQRAKRLAELAQAVAALGGEILGRGLRVP